MKTQSTRRRAKPTDFSRWVRARVHPVLHGCWGRGGDGLYAPLHSPTKSHYVEMDGHDRYLPSLTNYKIEDHVAGRETYYAMSRLPAVGAETLVYPEIDVQKQQKKGSAEGAELFAEYIRAHVFPGLYVETSRGGQGKAGYLRVRREEGDDEGTFNEAVAHLESFLHAIAVKVGADIEKVEVKGKVPVVRRDARGHRILSATYGDLWRLPKQAGRLAELQQTPVLTPREIMRLDVSALTLPPLAKPAPVVSIPFVRPPSPEQVWWDALDEDEKLYWDKLFDFVSEEPAITLVPAPPSPAEVKPAPAPPAPPPDECWNRLGPQRQEELLREVPELAGPEAAPPAPASQQDSPSPTPRTATPSRQGGSVSGLLFDERELIACRSAAADLVAVHGLPTVKNHRAKIINEDVGITLLILWKCSGKLRCADGSIPHRRVKKLWRALHLADFVGRGFLPNRYIAIRNWLSANGLIDWADERYQYADKKRNLDGIACRFSLIGSLCQLLQFSMEMDSFQTSSSSTTYSNSPPPSLFITDYTKIHRTGKNLRPAMKLIQPAARWDWQDRCWGWLKLETTLYEWPLAA